MIFIHLNILKYIILLKILWENLNKIFKNVFRQMIKHILASHYMSKLVADNTYTKFSINFVATFQDYVHLTKIGLENCDENYTKFYSALHS